VKSEEGGGNQAQQAVEVQLLEQVRHQGEDS
jgi:hypothetical protein